MQQPLSGLPNISFIKKLPNKSKNLNHKFTQPFSQYEIQKKRRTITRLAPEHRHCKSISETRHQQNKSVT